MKTRTITGTTKAWLSGHRGPEDISGDAERAIEACTYTNSDMSGSGWVLAGEAEITVRIVDTDGLIKNKVDSLEKAIKRVQAEAEREVNDLRGKIQNLLAISYTP